MFSKSGVDSECAWYKDTAKKILAHFQAILDNKQTDASIKMEHWERNEVTEYQEGWQVPDTGENETCLHREESWHQISR